MTCETIFEIVTYEVHDPARAEIGRRAARKALAAYPGFIAWQTYGEPADGHRFVDHVEWESLDEALAAQARFMTDPAVAAFRDEIGRVLSMVHVTRRD